MSKTASVVEFASPFSGNINVDKKLNVHVLLTLSFIILCPLTLFKSFKHVFKFHSWRCVADRTFEVINLKRTTSKLNLLQSLRTHPSVFWTYTWVRMANLLFFRRSVLFHVVDWIVRTGCAIWLPSVDVDVGINISFSRSSLSSVFSTFELLWYFVRLIFLSNFTVSIALETFRSDIANVINHTVDKETIHRT